MNIAVVGTGYVGLVSGSCFAETGATVTCVDVDAEKIERLQRGEIPIYEPGLDELVKKNVAAGRLCFTTDLASVLDDVEIVFSAVGTPPDEDGSADLKYVLQVARTIGQNLNHYVVVVTKSTVPVGTARKVRNAIDEEKYASLIAELKDLPSKIEKILSEEEDIKKLASEIRNAKDIFFIGREIDYATSLEGSLKMKEISYIHSEAYAAGELKHGTISLIEKGTPVVGILTQSNVYEKTISNLIETKTRGAHIICIVSEDKEKANTIADDIISIPNTAEYFMTSLAIIPLQLLSYYVSVQLGLNVDKPRNLAKSVTVE
jgi:hypothetical protein